MVIYPLEGLVKLTYILNTVLQRSFNQIQQLLKVSYLIFYRCINHRLPRKVHSSCHELAISFLIFYQFVCFVNQLRPHCVSTSINKRRRHQKYIDKAFTKASKSRPFLLLPQQSLSFHCASDGLVRRVPHEADVSPANSTCPKGLRPSI